MDGDEIALGGLPVPVFSTPESGGERFDEPIWPILAHFMGDSI
jgi:hypothetical protein